MVVQILACSFGGSKDISYVVLVNEGLDFFEGVQKLLDLYVCRMGSVQVRVMSSIFGAHEIVLLKEYVFARLSISSSKLFSVELTRDEEVPRQKRTHAQPVEYDVGDVPRILGSFPDAVGFLMYVSFSLIVFDVLLMLGTNIGIVVKDSDESLGVLVS